MDEDSKQAPVSNGFDGGVLPEVEAYAFLLVVTYLIDTDNIEVVSWLPSTPHAYVRYSRCSTYEELQLPQSCSINNTRQLGI